MDYIVGAYAASPTAASWDPAVEAAYLTQVAAIPGFGGLELPFTGELHRDEAWLLDHLDPAWDLVLTAIPGTVARNAADPDFGLASPREHGRQAAVDFTADLRRAVRRLNDWAERAAVVAVEIHSAPTATGVAAAFARSLAQIAEWDWDGAALTVEHCDAVRPGRRPQKGYLSLADELAAVSQTGGVAGICVNWGRSAIEGRSPATPVEHVEAAAAAGALAGLMFSGVTDRPGPFGDAWLDAHLPPAPAGHVDDGDLRFGEPTSIMGAAQIGQALRAAGGTLFTGVKIGVRPADASLQERIGYLSDAVRMVDRARSLLLAPPLPDLQSPHASRG